VRYDQPELRDRLASEYALGTLRGRARDRFERLLRDDRALRDVVSEWQERLTPLAHGLDPVEPPPALLARIEKSIGLAPAAASARAEPATSRAHGRSAPAKSPTPLSRPGARPASAEPSFWQRLFGMPQLGMLAAGLVIGIGVATIAPLLLQPGEEATAQLPQSYAGILSDADGNATMLVTSLRHGKIAQIKVVRPIKVTAGQTLLLWALVPNEAPFLLGGVPASGKGTLRLPGESDQLLSKVTTLAVAVATNAPTPPTEFLIKGPCAKFW
jgi:anti-sigma-K factor RskA